MKKINYQKIKKIIKNTTNSPKKLFLRNYTETLKPNWLVFMPTDACNSRCRHCNIWRQKPTPNPLTTKEIEKTFSDPLLKNIKEVINTGGEPTLRNDLEEIFLIEHKCFPGAKLQLSTNAILPERALNLAESLLNKGIKISVGVSLDGVGEKHDFIRRVDGNFKKADWLLKELKKIGLDPVISFTLSNLTLDNLDEIKKYGDDLNLEVFVQWYNQAPFYSNINEKLTDNKLKKKIESFQSSFTKEMWMGSLENKPIKFSCFALYTFLVLNCNGDVVPCLNHFDKPAGNVRENTPTEIWHSLKMKKTREMVKKCPGCLNEWCAGWSFESCMFPVLSFYASNPQKLIKRLKERGI